MLQAEICRHLWYNASWHIKVGVDYHLQQLMPLIPTYIRDCFEVKADKTGAQKIPGKSVPPKLKKQFLLTKKLARRTRSGFSVSVRQS